MKLSDLSRNRVGPLVLSTAPIAWLGWFYLYVLRYRIFLGYWPRPLRPDPGEAGFIIHQTSIWLTFLAVPIAAVIAVGWLASCRLSDRHYRWKRTAVLLAGSMALWVTILGLDPGDYFNWFVD